MSLGLIRHTISGSIVEDAEVLTVGLFVFSCGGGL
jgi:hypothetical protein